MSKSGATINRKDLEDLKKKFGHLESFKKVSDMEMRRATKEGANLAIEDFRSTFNQINGAGRGSIVSRRIAPNYYVIEANKEYMPFLEFGTITKVDLSPLDALGIDRNYALQFKGKGLKKRGGIKAGHYFFPNVLKAYNNMIDRMKRELNKALSR